MKVSVVMAFPLSQEVMELDVAENCCAREAVDHAVGAGLSVIEEGFDVQSAPLGVFGIRVADDAPLKEGDRVEIYRPLQQDPMELRRKRAALESGGLTTRRK